jgi:hypothetical protein
MKNLNSVFAVFLMIGVFHLTEVQAQEHPEKLRRTESFLGVHFDFHAGDDCVEIGKNVTPEMINTIIDRVKPDYIQVDCKGHRGLSSYPTKVGNPAPGFVQDALKIFREVTAERGIALFCHYSGVLDAEAVKQHPEWAIQGADGKTGGADGRVTSVFGPYVDELLIPQLKELNDVYQIDGVWIDGECWGMERDYRPEILKKYQDQTGLQNIPRGPEDPGWQEFSTFFRDGFRRYVEHYVSELHKHNPNFQIASNWAYSSFMPEPLTTGVDFLSGDVVPNNPLNAARLESRLLAQQGMPWDLMAWSFTINWDDPGGFQSSKSLLQLEQEAAEVLSQGGGFQVYFPQNRDASVDLTEMNIMAGIAEFCRARQAYCHKGIPVPQIGLILSTDAYYRKIRSLFYANHGEMNGFKGILQMLLESQQVVDVVMEHHLNEDMDRYPLLIYPEWETISPDFKKRLIHYVERGGHVLAIGPAACRLFQEELGIQMLDSLRDNVNHLAYNEITASIKSLSQRVKLGDTVSPFGKIYTNRRKQGGHEAAASIRRLGKGSIAGVYLNLGERYLNGRVTLARDFLDALVETLFPNPIVTVEGSHYVDVTLNRIKGNLAVNLVNTAGPHDNKEVYVYDEIPPLGPIKIKIRLEKKPERVLLEPSKQKPDWRYAENQLELTIQRLGLHEVLLINE